MQHKGKTIICKTPKMNKAVFDLLCIEEIRLDGKKIEIDWAFSGDEENTTSRISRQRYDEYLAQQGYLTDTYDTTDEAGEHVQKSIKIDSADYFRFAETDSQHEHMKQFIATYVANNRQVSINSLKALAKTA